MIKIKTNKKTNKSREMTTVLFLSYFVNVHSELVKYKEQSPMESEFSKIDGTIKNNEELFKNLDHYISSLGEDALNQLFKLKETIENFQTFIEKNGIFFQYDKKKASKFKEILMKTNNQKKQKI